MRCYIIGENEEVGEGLATDSPPVGVDLGSTPTETDSSEIYPIPSGTLDDLQRFYGAAETVGADIDSQLADIVDTLLTSRLPERKVVLAHSIRQLCESHRDQGKPGDMGQTCPGNTIT